ncbi:hypothetical protein KSP39_PZI003448 [Platanthera zijinensis]|uniref:Uncharacterized protein n=1 Tax=Platanthera zijinensis TaxID=2320716 RepID=A0AAP0BVM6_9ASPA
MSGETGGNCQQNGGPSSSPSISLKKTSLKFQRLLFIRIFTSSKSNLKTTIKTAPSPLLLNPTEALNYPMPPASGDSSPSTSTTEQGVTKSADQKALKFHFSSLNNIPPWAKLVLGSAVLLAFPLFRREKNWNLMAALKKTAEAAVKAADELVEAADKVVEAAEKLGEAAEKVLEEVVEALPGGGLKEAAIKLEEIAAYVDKRAEYADSLLDAVDDVLDDTAIQLRAIKVEELQDIISGEEKRLNSSPMWRDESFLRVGLNSTLKFSVRTPGDPDPCSLFA